MQDVQQVALDAEKTKVHCELQARCDAVKAERATNGGARAKDCVRGGPIGDGRRAGAIPAHRRSRRRSPSNGRSDGGREASEKPRKRLLRRPRVAAVSLSITEEVSLGPPLGKSYSNLCLDLFELVTVSPRILHSIAGFLSRTERKLRLCVYSL